MAWPDWFCRRYNPAKRAPLLTFGGLLETKISCLLSHKKLCKFYALVVISTDRISRNRLFHTAYMGTVNSSEETRSRAERIAKTIGAFHTEIYIDDVVTAHESVIQTALGIKPRYTVEG